MYNNPEFKDSIIVEELFDIPEEFRDSFMDSTIPIPLEQEDFWATTDFNDNL